MVIQPALFVSLVNLVIKQLWILIFPMQWLIVLKFHFVLPRQDSMDVVFAKQDMLLNSTLRLRFLNMMSVFQVLKIATLRVPLLFVMCVQMDMCGIRLIRNAILWTWIIVIQIRQIQFSKFLLFLEATRD